MQRSVDAATDP